MQENEIGRVILSILIVLHTEFYQIHFTSSIATKSNRLYRLQSAHIEHLQYTELCHYYWYYSFLQFVYSNLSIDFSIDRFMELLPSWLFQLFSLSLRLLPKAKTTRKTIFLKVASTFKPFSTRKEYQNQLCFWLEFKGYKIFRPHSVIFFTIENLLNGDFLILGKLYFCCSINTASISRYHVYSIY